MAIFGQYQGGDNFNVAGNMRDVLKGQQGIHDSMLQAVEKFNTARQEMDQLQAVTGSILGQYKVDEKGNPDPTAPKYVHDMFKAVNKEGGLANMSKSQMLAGIKAYETGFGLEQQKLQQDAARENIRGANIANTAREIELKRIQEAEAERLRIKEAAKAQQAEIERIAKTKLDTKTEQTEVQYGSERIKLSTAEIKPYIERLSKAKTPQEQEEIKTEIARLLYDKSRYSKKFESGEEYDPYGVSGQVTNESEIRLAGQGKANPLYREFVSPYAKSEPNRYDKATGQKLNKDAPRPTLNRTLVDSYVASELARFKASTPETLRNSDNPEWEAMSRGITTEQLQIDRDYTTVVNETLKALRKEIVENGNIDETWRPSKLGSKLKETADRLGITLAKSDQRPSFLSIDGKTAKNEKELLRMFEDVLTQVGSATGGASSARARKTSGKILAPEARVNAVGIIDKAFPPLEKQLSVADDKLNRLDNPYKAGAFETGRDVAFEETTVTKEVQRSLYEQTDDEFALMVNYLKANGGVPASFTKEAFYASKGIIRPTIMPLGNGQTYVKMGGLEQIVKDQNVSGSQMTIMDQKRLYDAKQLGTQSNMNGLNVNGYSFSGQLRVGDIDQANKVRDGVFKTTRALAAVDQMINIAENASMFDKLMPTEVSGIAQSLTNAAQAANRTEIGGSGSWSNQDQIYMDKVIRDPSSGFNTLFSSQTIASLKEYRRRLETSLHDSGTVYGFAFEKGGRNNSDGLDSQRQQFRVLFASYMAQGLSKEEALQRAISDSEADYE